MTPKELRARTAEFARVINLFCQPLLLRPATRAIAEQLLDASSSVASNHRAAGRGRSHAEFTAKIGIVDEEADESLYWLEHLRDCRLVTLEQVGDHIREASELSAIFTTSAKTARAREDANRAAKRRRPRRRRKPD